MAAQFYVIYQDFYKLEIRQMLSGWHFKALDGSDIIAESGNYSSSDIAESIGRVQIIKHTSK
jgi:hypothetical protein